MHLVMGRLDGEYIAAHFRVAGHRLPVDIIADGLGDRDAVGGQFLHVVGKAGKLTMVAIPQGSLGLVYVTDELNQQARAKGTMLGNESRDLRHGFDALIFADGDALEPLIIVDGVFFGSLDRGGFEHRGDLRAYVVGILVRVDPCAMKIPAVIGSEAGNVDAGAGGCGGRHLGFPWVWVSA